MKSKLRETESFVKEICQNLLIKTSKFPIPFRQL